MSQTLIFEGQVVVYNHQTKIAKTTIQEPFYSAGKILGWEENVPGIGLNRAIVAFVLKTKCHLIVFVGSVGKDYYINYDKLKNFLDTHNCDYIVNNTTQLKVISWKKFTRFVRTSEITS